MRVKGGGKGSSEGRRREGKERKPWPLSIFGKRERKVMESQEEMNAGLAGYSVRGEQKCRFSVADECDAYSVVHY